MGKMKPTPNQQNAIDWDNSNIIVSAGAGSGKTAVLSQRVIRKLKEGVHIDELLILTFTNAAAKEMKDRIRQNIIENKLYEELDRIDSSYIMTFDAFSLFVLKKYSYILNISSNITPTDEVRIDLEIDKALEEILDELYKENKINKLINDFCLKNDKDLKKYIKIIYKKIDLKIDKDNYINNYINNFYNDNNINNYINEYINNIKSIIESIKDNCNLLLRYLDNEYVYNLIDELTPLFNSNTYIDIKNHLEVNIKNVPRGSTQEGKNIKSNISNTIKELKELCIYEDTNIMYDEIKLTQENSSILIDIISKLNKKIDKIKQINSYYTFNDIARLSIKILKENTNIKEELKNKYNEIMIDEYQDTSQIEEDFISLISNNNIYMVGDIKQSIYRFRNANPYIFKTKYDNYKNNIGGKKIDLSDNFRSRENVLNNINLIFDYIMDDEIGGADYKKEHRLIFGNKSYTQIDNQNNDLEIIEIDNKKDEYKKFNINELEAFYTTNDIKDKINNNFKIKDIKTGEIRNCTYSDFTLLCDRSTNFELYKKIFEYNNIPLDLYKDTKLTGGIDIIIIRNLIKLIILINKKEYTKEFKYNFISISRSFLFKTSDEEIYDIFINNKYKDTKLYKLCYEASKKIDILSPANFLLYIIDLFDYENKLIQIGNILEYRSRLEYIYNLINDDELSIYEFIDYLDKINDGEYDLKFNMNLNSSNSVKMMTIHKSKGLEYPIVYLVGMSSKFNFNELKNKIIYDDKYGIILPNIINDSYKYTIINELLKRYTRKEEISEKLRLLYVALTRAKEKLIFVMPKVEEYIEINDIVNNYDRLNYNSFYDIIKSVYYNLDKYIVEKQINVSKDYLTGTSIKQLSKEDNILQVNELKIEKQIIETSHFSKDELHIIDKEEKDKLEYGTNIHKILELIDFKNTNLDKYNLNDKTIKQINNFINSNIIKDNINNKMYKEYEFIYLDNNIKKHGIIDLLILRDDYNIIIDYKSSNIDDINYIKQLKGYKDYIISKTNKQTKCYLYSIQKNIFKEVT